MSDATDHVARNRAAWDDWAAEYEDSSLCAWSRSEPSWGLCACPSQRWA